MATSQKHKRTSFSKLFKIRRRFHQKNDWHFHLQIDINFEQIYPDKSLNLFTKWTNNFSRKLFLLIVTDVKDRALQKAFIASF